MGIYPATMVLQSCYSIPPIYLFPESQIIAANTTDSSFGEVEPLDSCSQRFQVRYIACLQVFGNLFLNIRDSPEILLTMLVRRLKQALQDQFWGR